MFMKAGLQEFPVASVRVWWPWPALREQPMRHPSTVREPEQSKVLFRFTVPSARAMDRVRILAVEPGS